jgi:hypothetical protein
MFRYIMLLFALSLLLVFSSTAAMAGIGVGGSLLMSLPQEDFANVSEIGGGLGLKFLFSPTLAPAIAVRADAAFVVYGSENYREQVAGIPVDITVRNQSAQFTVGPQLQMPAGPVRFYVAPLAGVYNYNTRVEIEGTDVGETQSSTTKFGWNISAGLLVRVYESPIKKLKLDVDLEGKYHTIKDAIETEIDGVVEKSDANDVSLMAGVLFSF